MEFGKRIGKGLWAFADKALVGVNGLAVIFLVQRVLPSQAYGEWVLIQVVFLIATGLCTSFALAPLTKYVAETEDKGPYVTAGLVLSGVFFVLTGIFLFAFQGWLLPLISKSKTAYLEFLYGYLPLMFLTAWYRTYAVSLLQATYAVVRIFWIDAAYYLGMPVLIVIAIATHHFSTSQDVMSIYILSLALSTLLAIPLTFREMHLKFDLRGYAFLNMWHFGKYGLVGNSMYTIFMQMDIFFVSSIAGFAWVAAYSVAKTFNRVFDMMTGVIQMFLLPFSSKAGAEGNTSGLVTVAEKTICFSFIALLPCFIVMFFFPQPFLHLIYKGKYDDAAPIMRVLSLFALILPVNAVIGSYLQGLGKVREGFISGVVLVCISVPLYYFLTPVWGAVGTAAGLVTGFLITTIGLVIYLRTFAPITLKGVLLRVGDIRNFLIKFLSRS